MEQVNFHLYLNLSCILQITTLTKYLLPDLFDLKWPIVSTIYMQVFLSYLEPDSEENIAHLAGLQELVRHRQHQALASDLLLPHSVVGDRPEIPK